MWPSTTIGRNIDSSGNLRTQKYGGNEQQANRSNGFGRAEWVLAWRVLVTGLAEYYVGRDTPEADAGALRWRSDQSVALYRQGLALAGRDPAAAMRLYQAAAWANPTDALVYLALAELHVGLGQPSVAVALAEIADALGPMRTPVLARSAAFWLAQGRPDRALARWGHVTAEQVGNRRSVVSAAAGLGRKRRGSTIVAIIVGRSAAMVGTTFCLCRAKAAHWRQWPFCIGIASGVENPPEPLNSRFIWSGCGGKGIGWRPIWPG